MKKARANKQYDHAFIEKKWQKKWESKKPNAVKEKLGQKKFYGLIEFPYPSGDGLHVGHIRSNTAMDIIARKRRREGFNVLYPIGWDAFGLPTENYAIKTGMHPALVTKNNTDTFRRQLKELGFSFDWSRELDTTDPKYYRWTQWIFLQFLKEGLAYKKKMTINWCPKDLIGLANEEVINGKCERCGTPVEKREKEQWMLAITKYAERLLNDLDAVDTTNAPHIIDKKWPPRKGKKTVERRTIHALVRDPKTGKFLGLKWKKFPWVTFIVGGVEDGEDVVEAAKREVEEETGYSDIKFVQYLGGPVKAEYYAAHKDQNRIAITSGLLFELVSDSRKEVALHDKEMHETIWMDPKDMNAEVMTCAELPVWLERLSDLAKWSDPNMTRPLLDWPEHIKEAQRNWIGKSEGALLKFKIQISNVKDGDQFIEVFTTRPDTLFGVTYIVLAPEHPLVNEFLPSVSNSDDVKAYIAKARATTDIERTDISKDKTGVELIGVKAVNPANNKEVPVWIADYVLPDYGTGAVMAVPAHDVRDWDFAKKYGLEIRQVIVQERIARSGDIAFKEDEPVIERNVIRAAVKHWSEDKYLVLKWIDNGWRTFISGGIEGDEDAISAAKREVLEETGYKNLEFVAEIGGPIRAKFYAPHKKQNRIDIQQGLLFTLKDGATDPVSDTEKARHIYEWVSSYEIGKLFDETLVDSVLFKRISERKLGAFTDNGVLINSAQFSGRNSSSAMKEITKSVGGEWVTKYKLRDWIFSRQRYWGEPIPVISCAKCGLVPVPEKDLPVELPDVKNYLPTKTGESPLAAITKWVNTQCPKCKGPARRETDTMPNWAGSSWYYLRYTDPKNSKAFADKKKLDYWTPVDWYNGGMEHTTLHLLYSRFWHKFLFDLGLVPTSEPYKKRTSHGLILAEGGVKMSKSKGNVINPDSLVKTVGADSLRLYEMFMGPFDQPIAWNTENIAGVRRFIERVWKLKEKLIVPASQSHFPDSGERLESQTKGKLAERKGHVDRILHKTIKKVSDDIEAMRFNTAVSSLMIAVNELEKQEQITSEQYETIILLLAPFAPHVTEEVWANLGNKASIHSAPWPNYDPSLAKDEEMKIIVQVNGKMRGSFMAQPTSTHAELEAKAKEVPEVKKWLENADIVKVITVPNRLVNIVTKSLNCP